MLKKKKKVVMLIASLLLVSFSPTLAQRHYTHAQSERPDFNKHAQWAAGTAQDGYF